MLLGYGPIPAGVARALALHPSAPRWIRRLYTDTSRLTGLDTHRREFSAGQRAFLRLRDQTCRTPWCHAPIRHADHVRPHARGGPTSITNGQGLCQACNHAKQAPHWTGHAHGDTITTTTPTGHHYPSRPPDPPGTSPPAAATTDRAAPAA